MDNPRIIIPNDDEDDKIPVIDPDILDQDDVPQGPIIDIGSLDEEEAPAVASGPVIDLDDLDEDTGTPPSPVINIGLLDDGESEEENNALAEILGTDLDVVKETFPENIIEFFGRATTDVVLGENEELPLDNTSERAPAVVRLGIEKSAIESASELLNKYGRPISVAKRLASSGHKFASQDSTALGKITSVTNLSFLTAGQQSSLLLLVSTMSDKKQIVNTFTQQYELSPANRLKLSNAVEKILIEYAEYKRTSEILRSVNGGSDTGDFNETMKSIEQDLITMRDQGQDGNVTIVRKVFKSRKGITFICGNCEASVESEEDFVKIVVHENLGERDSYLQVFPKGCFCDKCGKLNILTDEEHRRISTRLNSAYNAQLTRWAAKSTKKLSSAVNIITYVPEKNKLPDIYPALYEEQVEETSASRKSDKNNFSDIFKWYKELMEVIKTLTVSETKGEGGVKMVKGVPYPKEDELYDNLRAVARMYCGMFNEDYDTLRKNAVNTLLLYLKEHGELFNTLSNDTIYSYEALLVYENYLDKDLGQDVSDIYEEICAELDIPFVPFVDESGNVNLVIKNITEEKIRERIKHYKKELETVKESQRKALDSLNKLLPFFGYFDINGVSRGNMTDLDGLLCIPEIRVWLERASLLMVINRVAPKALEIWKTLRIDGYKNASLFSQNTKKTFSKLMDKAIAEYTKEYMDKGLKAALGGWTGYFLSREMIDQSYMSNVYSLRSSIENRDSYSFYESIVALKPLLGFQRVPLRHVQELIKSKMEDAEKFLSSRGDKDKLLDYYVYHFGDIFTEEEISNSLSEIRERFKRHYRIERKDGESFASYILRLKSEKFDPEVHKPHGDRDLFLSIREYVPAVFSLFEYLRVIAQIKQSKEHVVFMNDIILYSHIMGTKVMFKFLGLPEPWAELYEKDDNLGFEVKDGQEVRLNFILKNLIYPSKEVNMLVKGGSEEVRDIFDLIEAEPDLVESQLDYLGELGGLVREHYFS